MIPGIILALIEVLFIFTGGYYIRKNTNLQNINPVIYYWLILTVFTGLFWETAFVLQYKETNKYSQYLILNDETVWTNHYTLDYLLPWKFSKIFYGDYGAYADREYMETYSDWSRVIESTHAIFCGLFALISLCFHFKSNYREFLLTLGVSMGSQLMNSILYMVEYFVQVEDPFNINYDTPEFPTGFLLSKRPFMWVNIFWTILPAYSIIYYLTNYQRNLQTFTKTFKFVD